jgi:hypothetical protein
MHRQTVRAEGVSFEHVHADFEEGAVDFLHGFGIRDDEVVVTTIKLFAAKMFGGQVLQLQARSHCAIEDEDFLFKCVEITTVGVFAICHLLIFPSLFVLPQINTNKLRTHKG